MPNPRWPPKITMLIRVIRVMPARLPNALWYRIMFARLSHIKPVQMFVQFVWLETSYGHAGYQ